MSVGEHLDAAAAVASIPLNDREVLRAALAATLVKDGDHLGAFNLIFDLYTSGPPPGQGESRWPDWMTLSCGTCCATRSPATTGC